LIRSSVRTASVSLAALVALSLPALKVSAQTDAPVAPDQTAAPQAPAPNKAPAFPKPDPANFTATTPSKDVLNVFLQNSWGKVEGRVWQLQAVLKTPIDGLTHVVVLVGDKAGKEEPQVVAFYAFADGKHYIAGDRLVVSDESDKSKPEVADEKAAQAVPESLNTVFPKPEAKNFTAALPKLDTINKFLFTTWGYNEGFIWQVEAIQKTQMEGLSRVVVLLSDKASTEKPQPLVFFALADGKHVIAGDQIIPFGEKPYAEAREKLQAQANGPYRGSPNKDLEIVEFADFQCPHCKLAQPNMDKLAADYPQARFVFQADPIAQIHPAAVKAASYGFCVAKLAGSTAFFPFASTVFEGQDGLANADGVQLTLNSAMAKAGVDAAKVIACSDAAETKAVVDASVKLAAEVGINQVPTLMVNGRQVPANAPYETLKKIIDFQISLDGLKK